MVNAPKGDYVFYIATKNNDDQRWEEDNAAYELQRKVSKILWEWFEGQ
jgi:beta-lactamase class A